MLDRIRAAEREITGICAPPLRIEDALVTFEGEADAIVDEFRRRLSGLRHLGKDQRALARRLAFNWRAAAMRALREKRAGARSANWLRRRLQAPKPDRPGL